MDGQDDRRRSSCAAGDLVETRLADRRRDRRTAATGTLEQPPLVEGAVLAIDNRTGQIRAMVGGYSFERSKFNRATQAYRQVGSAFKPIVYTAAIDRGYTPVDDPHGHAGELLRRRRASPPYAPMNYDQKFEGPITLRHALEESRNVPAVRVMEQLGPQAGHRIRATPRPRVAAPAVPAVALGAAEATLMEMTSAYSVFPNQGVRMRPYSVLKVTDREGNVLEENRPEPKDAIRADTAFVMTNLLRGVVQRGTAAKAAALNWPLGGKTGTTDDYTDAWFIGFDPDITIGRLGRLRPEEADRPGADRRRGGAADLDRHHEGLDRRPQGAAEVRAARQHRVPVGRSAAPASWPTTARRARSREAFIAGTQPGLRHSA